MTHPRATNSFDTPIKFNVAIVNPMRDVDGAVEKVVHYQELEEASANGWRYVEAHRAQRIGMNNIVLDEPVFLVRKDPNAVVEELRAQLEEARAAKAEALKSEGTFMASCAVKDRDIAEMRSALESLGEAHRAQVDETRRLREANRKMEAHLAKVREEIGGERMREIVGPDEDPESRGPGRVEVLGGGVGWFTAPAPHVKGGEDFIEIGTPPAARGKVGP